MQSCVNVCMHMHLCIWGWGGRSSPEPSSEPQSHSYSQRMHAIIVELLEKEIRFLLTLLGLFQNYGTGLTLEITSMAAVVHSQFLELAQHIKNLQDPKVKGWGACLRGWWINQEHAGRRRQPALGRGCTTVCGQRKELLPFYSPASGHVRVVY